MVTLQYYGAIRAWTNCREERVDASTLGLAMAHVRSHYGKEALRIMRSGMITLDGARVETLKRSLPLPDGAALGIFPLCGGG